MSFLVFGKYFGPRLSKVPSYYLGKVFGEFGT